MHIRILLLTNLSLSAVKLTISGQTSISGQATTTGKLLSTAKFFQRHQANDKAPSQSLKGTKPTVSHSFTNCASYMLHMYLRKQPGTNCYLNNIQKTMNNHVKPCTNTQNKENNTCKTLDINLAAIGEWDTSNNNHSCT